MCCSVLQCAANGEESYRRMTCTGRLVFNVLQYVAVCCSVLQCVAVSCSMLHCVAVCCSVSERDALRCGVLKWQIAL